MSGPGRLLAMTYALFALAAGARSITQIATDFGAAPLPYALSLLAAMVYLLLAVTISRPKERGIAVAACCFELSGVLIVGAASLAHSDAFPDATVWSGFGSGYGFVPLALPLAGLLFLRARRGSRRGIAPPRTDRADYLPRCQSAKAGLVQLAPERLGALPRRLPP